MGFNKIMVTSGVITLLQAVGQLVFSSMCIAQYFCVIDFLRGLPLLIYIRVLYFHNPVACGPTINIGQAIDGIANEAFVLLYTEPFTVFRTFIINCVSLGLSVFWMTSSIIIIMAGARDNQTKCTRWPWIIFTTAVSGLDVVATVTYANDTFHTRTLQEMMDFIGGRVSGIGNAQLNTAWTAWSMVILYSRFVILFIINIILIVIVIVDCNVERKPETDIVTVEAPVPVQIEAAPQAPVAPQVPVQVSTAVQASPPPPMVTERDAISDRDEELASLPSERITTRIPRAGLSRSFRRMKAFLFRKTPSPEIHNRSNPDSFQISPERSPHTHHVHQQVDIDLDKKRTVNFPESLLSLPQRLENIIAEQQRRLDRATIDTSGRNSPPRASQSMPHLATTSSQPEGRGRRGTTAELQGQLPWAYIPASSHRMRDQLPPDEDLPPVPLPDYNAMQPARKASVHRAASSLSSLTQKKNYVTSRSVREYYTYKKT
ncbi:uncharacterized protein LOC118265110 isoform X2 [Spodoptera frugiperda]|uniref:Uncharacterized protein LOC118265110 isoform X2 n=1 Tax=Spodoptera frugiperda TaxID=7108 RepID=A0A9R0E8P4_SPOFR|nr:uncharacterized protein LOC118265110 isoform X2 [Spodoptera frugiperda]XP_050560451.1 uncharacterized protein LOC118265110 isoform X2 [Spodoptera frugiperda]